MTRLLSTFLLVAFLHNSIIIFIMHIENDEWSLDETALESMGGDVGSPLVLSFTNSRVLPEPIFAEAAFRCGFSVEKGWFL